MTFGLLFSPRIRLVLAAGLALSCESVLGAPDYHVVDAGANARKTPATPAALTTLYAAASPDAESCTECLAGTCGEAFQQCMDLPGCPELAACLLEEPSPASDLKCVVELTPSAEARGMTTALYGCYAQCVAGAACGAATDFRCVGNYSYSATPPNPWVHLTQTLRFTLDPPDPKPAGVEISVCQPGIGCDPPIATATTDEDGFYSAKVPIHKSPSYEAGFRGFRLVHGQDGVLFPHRLQSNRRVMVDQVEYTGIFHERRTQESIARFGFKGLNTFLVQMLDCRLAGAGGVYFEVDSPGARIEYLHTPETWGAGPTLSSMDGMALVLDVEPRQFHEVRAVTGDGKILAVDNVYVPGDVVVISVLVPMEIE